MKTTDKYKYLINSKNRYTYSIHCNMDYNQWHFIRWIQFYCTVILQQYCFWVCDAWSIHPCN